MSSIVDDDWVTATAVLRLAGRLVDGIQSGVAERGFPDVRPAHGFAFARLAASPATTAELAAHLGMTKQAAGELVQGLVDRGYVGRRPDPTDRRARLLFLTDRGTACTRAAEAAAVDTLETWRRRLPAQQFSALHQAVRVLAGEGRLRPAR
jgi:DNA-binding MarR family transcriptional regulator